MKFNEYKEDNRIAAALDAVKMMNHLQKNVEGSI
jgi:hypothetical protein